MSEDKGKVEITFKDGKLILAYQYTSGKPRDAAPTFAVEQKLGWKVTTDPSGGKKVDLSGTKLWVIDAGKVKGKGTKFSFTYDLSEDVTDLVVKVWDTPPKSPDDPTIHEDEDVVALSRDLLNRKTVTVLKVLVDGKAVPHIVEFSAVATGQKGASYRLSGVVGTFTASDLAAQNIANAPGNRFPPEGTIALRWKVADLAPDTKVEVAVDRMDFVGRTTDSKDPKKKLVPPESPPEDGHVLEVSQPAPGSKPERDVKFDVTAWTTDGEGSAVFRDQGNFTFYCDLRLKDAAGTVLESQTICASGDYPLPVLSSFKVTGEDGAMAISPANPTIRVRATTANAHGNSLWLAVTKPGETTVIEHILVSGHRKKKDSIDQTFELDKTKYTEEGSVDVWAGLFGLSSADKGPVGDAGSSAKADPPWKVPGEGAFWKGSQPQRLKVSWTVDKSGALWIKAPNPGTWQWKVGGKMEDPAPVAGGSGFFADSRLPFAQLQKIAGAQRINVEGQDVGAFKFSIDDQGHYLVRKAAKDGTPDESTLLVAGQFGPGQPDVLRHLPSPGQDDLSITVTKWDDAARTGKAFPAIRHFFILMLENRSYDHMFGHQPELREGDGTLNPDGSPRTDCYSWDCEALSDNSDVQQTSTKVGPLPGTDTLIIDPGHELSNIHYGIWGWDSKGSANRAGVPEMHGFIAPYLNRLIPRTVAQGQWDGDAADSHTFKWLTSNSVGSIASALVPALWPVAVYNALKTTDEIKKALNGARPESVSKAVMHYLAHDQIPAFSDLAKKYALCDRWFSSLPGPTWPNRLFVHCGGSGGLDDSPPPESAAWRAKIGSYELPNIYDVVKDAGCEWMIFAAGSNAQADTVKLKSKFTGANPLMFRRVVVGDTNFNQFATFLSSYNGVTKGSVTFLEPDYGALGINGVPQNNLAAAFVGGNSQHPISGAKSGDDLIARVVQILRSNQSVWNECALIVTHDENGGFYDHVPPPEAIAPGSGDFAASSTVQYRNARTTPGLTDAFLFTRYGVRVPCVIISPRIPQGVVDHTIYDHTSVPRTIRKAFGISGALSNREKWANDFSHLFTLTTPRTD